MAHRPDGAACLAGARDAVGVPAAVLAAGMLGFGAFALEYGFNVWLALLCTAGVWALPGQLVLLEMYSNGAPGYLTVIAVMLTGTRFLPMTMTLLPVIHHPRHSRLAVYLTAHLIAMTGWAWAMQRCPKMPQEKRFPYFVGFALTCWAVSIVATGVGFFLAGWFPASLRLGFVFLTPVYFIVILVGDVRSALAAWALVCGAVAGPLFHLLSPQWSLMLAGLVGGTLAYYIQRLYGHPHR